MSRIYQKIVRIWNRLCGIEEIVVTPPTKVQEDFKAFFTPVPVTYVPRQQQIQQENHERRKQEFIIWKENNRLLFG